MPHARRVAGEGERSEPESDAPTTTRFGYPLLLPHVEMNLTELNTATRLMCALYFPDFGIYLPHLTGLLRAQADKR